MGKKNNGEGWHSRPPRVDKRAILGELKAHLWETLVAAEQGDYDAREWLCESFPGNLDQFRRLWKPTEAAHRQMRLLGMEVQRD